MRSTLQGPRDDISNNRSKVQDLATSMESIIAVVKPANSPDLLHQVAAVENCSLCVGKYKITLRRKVDGRNDQ